MVVRGVCLTVKLAVVIPIDEDSIPFLSQDNIFSSFLSISITLSRISGGGGGINAIVWNF